MSKRTRVKDTDLDPRTQAIGRLDRVGVRVVQPRLDWKWFALRAADGQVLPGTNPLGYITEQGALIAAIRIVTPLIECRLATDRAYDEYAPVAAGRFTYANPDTFANKYRAMREYERVEASRLGLPIRPDLIAQSRPRGKA